MTQSVELLLDAAAEEGVMAEWATLAHAGLRSQASHPGATNRPHATLVSVPEIEPALEGPLAALCRDALPVDVRLGAVVVFEARRTVTVARLLVPTVPLLELHASVTALLADEDSLTSPGRWVPHVTLAHRMPPEQLGEALRVLGPERGCAGLLTAARRWDGAARRAWLLA